MKIAILHDDFTICGGGEKLVAILSNELNKRGIETDIYTFDISKETKKIIPDNLNIKTIGRGKGLTDNDAIKRYLFSQLNINSKYDLFIFSGHPSLCGAKKGKPNILYCHNIPKSETINNCEFKEAYCKNKFKNNLFKKVLVLRYYIKIMAHKIEAFRFLLSQPNPLNNLKYLTNQTTYRMNLKNIPKVIVNSENIKNKVKKYYKRDSTIIYPPIDTMKYKYQEAENYWLSINRITPLKRIEMQLKAFRRLPEEKLYIIGAIQNAKYYHKLKNIKPDNVTFLGTVD